MKSQTILFNKINEKELECCFLELNLKKLPTCFIIDDFCYDNKYLHVINNDYEYTTKFLVLNEDFIEYYLSFLLEIIKDPALFDIQQIYINKIEVSIYLINNDCQGLKNVLQAELDSFKKKNSPKSMEVLLVFPWTLSASAITCYSLYFIKNV